MFIESYIDARNARLLEKGRQEGRRIIADTLKSLISSTEGDTFSIPKKDLLALLEEADKK